MHKRAPIRAEHHLREECGVFGVFSARRRDLASLVYYGLFALQHRGQESAGIVVNDDGVFADHRGAGLVNEVFSPETLSALGSGNIAVGHVRYATTGSDSRSNIQPLLINHYKGRMALSHNGNLTNAWELRRALEKEGCLFHTTTDSEVIAYTIVRSRLCCPSMEAAVADAMDTLEGAYSLVIASPAKLIAARDIHGFRPLCMGTLPDGSTVFASESCALDAVGAAFVRDIDPGEIVTVDAQGVHSDRRRCGMAPRRGCVFEYIYFARPDSVIDGASVCHARQRAGELLAAAHSVAADVVIGVPDSGLDAAIGYARASGIPYAIGFTKNKYIGRSFIAPTQDERETAVNVKLNPRGGGGKAAGAHRRFHRPWNHLSAHHRASARRRGQGDPHAGQRAALRCALLLRHGYRHERKPDRQSSQRGGDRRDHRCGLSGLSPTGGRCPAHRQRHGLLHGLLRRKLSHRRADRAKGPF